MFYYVLKITLLIHLHQDSSTGLKRVYVSVYALKKLSVRQVQGNSYKKLKNTRAISVNQKQRMKNLFDFRFLKFLVTQNHNWAFNFRVFNSG